DPRLAKCEAAPRRIRDLPPLSRGYAVVQCRVTRAPRLAASTRLITSPKAGAMGLSRRDLSCVAAVNVRPDVHRQASVGLSLLPAEKVGSVRGLSRPA